MGGSQSGSILTIINFEMQSARGISRFLCKSMHYRLYDVFENRMQAEKEKKEGGGGGGGGSKKGGNILIAFKDLAKTAWC